MMQAMTRAFPVCVVIVVVAGAGAGVRLEAQRGAAPPTPARTPRAAAPIDLTGNWVSLVTQDWRWRMVTPAKGDYQGVQMTPAARKVADSWDPARDEAAGEQCKSYGAPALMSVPGRLRITWQDDTTLKVDTDAGQQTRLLRFGTAAATGPAGGAGFFGGPAQAASQPLAQTPADAPRSWQGMSLAQWLTPRPNVPLQLRPADRVAETPPMRPTGGSLRVVTTNLRAGYLRKNGVPYSENAVVTEHWDLYTRPNGEEWLTITTEVNDPQFLTNARLTAPVFKKERDGSKWDPTPCSARW